MEFTICIIFTLLSVFFDERGFFRLGMTELDPTSGMQNPVSLGVFSWYPFRVVQSYVKKKTCRSTSDKPLNS
jgi:hypothetical protein